MGQTDKDQETQIQSPIQKSNKKILRGELTASTMHARGILSWITLALVLVVLLMARGCESNRGFVLRPATQLQLRGGGRPNREVLRKTADSTEESSQIDDIVTAGDEGEDQDENENDDDEDPELQERERMLRREVEARPYDRVALGELADFLWETCGDKEGKRCIFKDLRGSPVGRDCRQL